MSVFAVFGSFSLLSSCRYTEVTTAPAVTEPALVVQEEPAKPKRLVFREGQWLEVPEYDWSGPPRPSIVRSPRGETTAEREARYWRRDVLTELRKRSR